MSVGFYFRLVSSKYFLVFLSKVAGEWLAHMLRVWEIPASNFGLVTGYPDRGLFVVFLGPFKLP
jgi:hypothetical protein